MIFLICSCSVCCKYRDATLNIFILPLALFSLVCFFFRFYTSSFASWFVFFFSFVLLLSNSKSFCFYYCNEDFFAHLDFSDFLRFYLSVILQFKSNPPMHLQVYSSFIVQSLRAYWYEQIDCDQIFIRDVGERDIASIIITSNQHFIFILYCY